MKQRSTNFTAVLARPTTQSSPRRTRSQRLTLTLNKRAERRVARAAVRAAVPTQIDEAAEAMIARWEAEQAAFLSFDRFGQSSRFNGWGY